MILSAGILFCLLAVMLLWVIIGGRGHWLVKCLLIIPSVWFSIAVSYSLPTMLGWPSESELPEEYEVHWIEIQNPNLKTGHPGRILVWAKDLHPSEDKYNWSLFKPDIESPRVHVIPYSKAMHKRANDAKKLIRQGKRVKGTNKKGKGRGKHGKGRGRGKGNGKGGSTGGGEDNDDSVGPKFYIMPPIKLPEKLK